MMLAQAEAFRVLTCKSCKVKWKFDIFEVSDLKNFQNGNFSHPNSNLKSFPPGLQYEDETSTLTSVHD